MLLSSIKMLFDSITQAKWESPLTASVHLGGFAKPKQHQGLRFPLTQEEGIAATAAGGFQSRRLDNENPFDSRRNSRRRVPLSLQMKNRISGFSFGGVSGNRTRACQFCRLKRYHFAITPYYYACAGYRAVVRLYQLFESVSSSSVMRCLFCSPKSGANSTWGRRWTRECFLR